MHHPVKHILGNRRQGGLLGLPSVCSASEAVIEAVLLRSREAGMPVLIEATANQCNQFGGYTGMKPADFRSHVYRIAMRIGFPKDEVILGGDHLGPITWAREDADSAMTKAAELVRQFVGAGFTKIHLDASMYLGGDDRAVPLSPAVVAMRCADLAAECERAYDKQSGPSALRPVYVVGSEVPIPGGVKGEDEVSVTSPAAFLEELELFNRAFEAAGAADAAERIVAVVVQPGVEFGNDSVHEYSREAAKKLTAALGDKYPLAFEGHSTDYQTKQSLRRMAEDGISVLKVGPAMTFAEREGLVALARIENELLPGESHRQSRFLETLDRVMRENPGYWREYYRGDENELRLARRYGFSDRCRYYLGNAEVVAARQCLMRNLSGEKIPMTLISQYLPLQYERMRQGIISGDPHSLLIDKIGCMFDDYLYAVIRE